MAQQTASDDEAPGADIAHERALLVILSAVAFALIGAGLSVQLLT